VSLRKTIVSREDIFRIEQRSKYNSLLTLSEQLVCVLEYGQENISLKILTSLLSMDVRALRKDSTFFLDIKRCKSDAQFSLNM
jgi:hypothetical protein